MLLFIILPYIFAAFPDIIASAASLMPPRFALMHNDRYHGRYTGIF